MVDLSALTSELNALVAAAPQVDWDKIAAAARVKIAEAALNGGVVTYQVNGRSVTRSLSELREILKLAESRGESQGGGIICQLGEFS
jgi:hypothetical protein